MTVMQNAITASGAVWSGDAPLTNTLSASGAAWASGGTSLRADGWVPLGGSAQASALVRAVADGALILGGAARAAEGAAIPSSRRSARPGDSRNGGHLVPRG